MEVGRRACILREYDRRPRHQRSEELSLPKWLSPGPRDALYTFRGACTGPRQGLAVAKRVHGQPETGSVSNVKFEQSLASGYFPVEVPPSFSTAAFAVKASGLTPMSGKPRTSPVRFSLARAGGLRRATELANPLAQIKLVDLCSKNWRTLQRLTANSSISLSRPLANRTGSLRYKAPLSVKPEIAVARMPGAAVTLRTDVSQFYPSIYTHAVDWAVRGKAAAKKRMRAPHLGKFLDEALREARSGQTVGLSIGPETSWVASEIVLARVDEALCKEFPQITNRAFRFVDDMTFYSSSTGEAYEVLARYEKLLAEFELALNPTKVRVLETLEPPESPWVTPLRQARYRDANDSQLVNDLLDLFSLAMDASSRYPTEGVLSYAIKRCDPFPGGARSWPVYRDLVLASVSHDASTLKHVYPILLFAKSHGLKVDNDRLLEVLNEACATHAALDHGFEVAWLLTILRDLGLPLDPATASQVALMDDNCSLVLLMDMVASSSGLGSTVDMSQAVRRAEAADALSSADWLLAYEFRAGRWCAPKKWDGILQWKQLNSAGVRFLVTQSTASARARIRRRRPAFIPGWSYT